MKERSSNSRNQGPGPIDKGMRLISLVLSLSALALMVSGFILLLLGEGAYQLPGARALRLSKLISWSSPPITLMSLGIVLLSLLPTARILLGIGVYLSSRELKNLLVAAIVLLELLLSLRLSF